MHMRQIGLVLLEFLVIMGFDTINHSHPKTCGQGSRCCRVCSNRHGLIRKYGLNMCRQCFRQYCYQIGFKKLD
ncbi:unnamed protein product [Dibothriocephalus latus]|uniref:Small ribosomal subunit protein uS14 n=2 Tax=Diphyllobothriidae TaxID=28843 RepID=A0A3P7LW79_DIBLA|nr:unnamed protein product [Dibothriocephalus latus]